MGLEKAKRIPGETVAAFRGVKTLEKKEEKERVKKDDLLQSAISADCWRVAWESYLSWTWLYKQLDSCAFVAKTALLST